MVAVLPDDKILVAGSARGDFLLMRFNADDTSDATFGAGGVDGDGAVSTDFGGTFDFATCMAVQPDGKVRPRPARKSRAAGGGSSSATIDGAGREVRLRCSRVAPAIREAHQLWPRRRLELRPVQGRGDIAL